MIKTLAKVMAVAAFFLVATSQSPEAASRCKSDAYDKSTAVEFCAAKLKCSEKSPPQEMICKGKTQNWRCWCAKPKPAGGNQSVPGGGQSTPSE